MSFEDTGYTFTQPYAEKKFAIRLDSSRDPVIDWVELDEKTSDTNALFDRIEPGEFYPDADFAQRSDGVVKAELVDSPRLPDVAVGSRNNVLFKDLQLTDSSGEVVNRIPVAVKPFDRYEMAAYEYTNAQYFAAGNVAGIDTFLPIGLTRTDDHRIATLTLFDGAVKTMNSVFLNRETVLNHPLVNQSLGRAAVSLALLHADWSHNDYRAANAVWKDDTAANTAFMVDLEFARCFTDLPIEKQDKLRRKDIARFFKSVFHIDLATDLPDRVMEHFGQTYIDVRSKATTSHSRITMGTIETIIDATLQQAA